MENHIILQRLSQGDPPSGKGFDLYQLIVTIGSGILSSTVLSIAIKTWFESRRTKMTIQITGDTKRLEYDGPALPQDAETIHGIIEQLKSEPASDETRHGRVKIVAIDSAPHWQQEPSAPAALPSVDGREGLEGVQVTQARKLFAWKRFFSPKKANA